MVQRLMLLTAICGVFTGTFSQELNLSVAAKSYTPQEQVWVNVSVVDAAAVPGAYAVRVDFNPAELTCVGLLPSSDGPFSVTPAASTTGGTVTVAGFQGITDTGRGTTSLVTVVFLPVKEPVAVDTTTFRISSSEVFSAQAQKMELKLTRQMTSVLLPAPQRNASRSVVIAKGYIKFTVRSGGITSVRVFDMNGRTVATPMMPVFCRPGLQAVPVGTTLKSGVYIVAVKGAGMHLTKKMEVVR